MTVGTLLHWLAAELAGFDPRVIQDLKVLSLAWATTRFWCLDARIPGA